MESHNVTCYPTQVNMLHLNPEKTGLYSNGHAPNYAPNSHAFLLYSIADCKVVTVMSKAFLSLNFTVSYVSC